MKIPSNFGEKKLLIEQFLSASRQRIAKTIPKIYTSKIIGMVSIHSQICGRRYSLPTPRDILESMIPLRMDMLLVLCRYR